MLLEGKCDSIGTIGRTTQGQCLCQTNFVGPQCNECKNPGPNCEVMDDFKVFVLSIYTGKAYIIDLDDPNYKCDLPDLSGAKWNSVGGLIDNQGILICGGHNGSNVGVQSCSRIADNVSGWKSANNLRVPSYAFGSGNIVFNDSLLISGGNGDGGTSYLYGLSTSISFKTMPMNVRHHCNIQINSTHYLLTGGYENDDEELESRTWIHDIIEDKWTLGPELSIPRTSHGCGSIEIGGSPYAFIAGGLTNADAPYCCYPDGGTNKDKYIWDGLEYLDTFEYLDLNNVEQSIWTLSTHKMSYKMSSPRVVTSISKKRLALTGGRNNNEGNIGIDTVLELVCQDEDPSTCAFFQPSSGTKLHYNDHDHIAIIIPEYWQVQLGCTMDDKDEDGECKKCYSEGCQTDFMLVGYKTHNRCNPLSKLIKHTIVLNQKKPQKIACFINLPARKEYVTSCRRENVTSFVPVRLS